MFLDLASKGGDGEEDLSPWAEARRISAARAVFFHLVVAPCALLVRWGFLLALLFVATFFVALPPLGACTLRALARMIQWGARVDSRLLDDWVLDTTVNSRPGLSVPVTIRGAAPAAQTAACCRCQASGLCGLRDGGKVLLRDPAALRALGFLCVIQPFVVLLCVFASALMLVVGVGSLAGFLPSLTVQKRIAIWHRDLSARYLCEGGVSRGAATEALNPVGAQLAPASTAEGVTVAGARA